MLRVVSHLVEVGRKELLMARLEPEDDRPALAPPEARARASRASGSAAARAPATARPPGRGHKGAGSRSGSKRKVGYEGGQNPIHMRMRKLRGPHKKMSMPFERFRTHTQPVNVSDLEARFDAGAEVTPETPARGRPGQAHAPGEDPRPAARSRPS